MLLGESQKELIYVNSLSTVQLGWKYAIHSYEFILPIDCIKFYGVHLIFIPIINSGIDWIKNKYTHSV